MKVGGNRKERRTGKEETMIEGDCNESKRQKKLEEGLSRRRWLAE